MSLIKDMLDNLENRSDSEKKRYHSNKENDKKIADSMISKNADHPRKWGLVVGGVVLAFVAGVSIYVAVAPQQFQTAKNKVTALANNSVAKKTTSPKTPIMNVTRQTKTAEVSQKKGQTDQKTMPASKVSKSSSAVHAMYLQAIQNLNEGNVDRAIADLKKIITEDPSFEPAQKTYKAITAKYGVNQQQ